VIQKLLEIKQNGKDSGNQYVSGCAKIILQLKSKTDILE
jgi:hypothetical protein